MVQTLDDALVDELRKLECDVVQAERRLKRAKRRALYPFAFRLVVTYTFDEAGLDVALKIVSTGEKTLPASVGGHPASNWPL